jgi:hypothetical protein
MFKSIIMLIVKVIPFLEELVPSDEYKMKILDLKTEYLEAKYKTKTEKQKKKLQKVKLKRTKIGNKIAERKSR